MVLDLKQAWVKRITRREAAAIIYRYEWLGTMGPSGHHYGLMLGPHLAGAVCISKGGAGIVGPVYKFLGVEPGELAFLLRGACVSWAPPGSNSKLVSTAVRLLRQDAPHLKVMGAYADPDAGEIGTIYQACGWYCLGQRKGGPTQIVSPHGRVMNTRVLGFISDRRGTSNTEAREWLQNQGWHVEKASNKWMYATLLDRTDSTLRDRLDSMRVPYPKRAGSIASDAPSDQEG